MGFIEKFEEIEKTKEELLEQLHNKIDFVHENVGKDYRTQDGWFDSDYTIVTGTKEEGEFVVVSYDYFRYTDCEDKLYIKKELLDMPEEEILKNKDTLKAELEAYNQKQTKLFEEEKQRILQLIKQREAAKAKPTREDMDER